MNTRMAITPARKLSALMLIASSFLILVSGCTKSDIDLIDNQDESVITTRSGEGFNDPFYYYFGEKIFLTERTDKILLQFAPDTNKESLSSFIDDNGLRSASKSGVGETISSLAIFEVDNGKKISTTALESLRSNPEILSASYLYEYKDGSIQGLSNDFIVRLKENTSYEQLLKLAEQNNCTVGEKNEFDERKFIVTLHVSSVLLNSMQMANLFYETELFEFSEPDFWLFNTKTSYDPYFISQWGLNNNSFNGGNLGTDIQAVLAWKITTGRPNVKIAVVDDGVDLTHPDLQANLVPGYDSTPDPITSGGPYWSEDNHGTAVAGIIAALQNNRVAGSYEGISGVAPGCKIIPVRALDGDHTTVSRYANAINWAWQNGADVINLSQGFNFHNDIAAAINNATTNGRRGRGCIVVASAGNDKVNNVGGPVKFPANLSNVIAVGAIGRTGSRASWSHYGTALDVVAPGDDGIYTTDRQDTLGYRKLSGTAGNYYPYFAGTSAAAPFVSGIAALILSAHPPLTNYYIPELSYQQVKDIIIQSADRYPNRHNEYGYGLPDAYKAVSAALNAFCSNWHISGPGSVVWNANVSYSFPSPPPSVTFNGWTVTPNNFSTGGMDDRTLNISFHDSPQYTVKANFTMPDGSPFSITKTVTNTVGVSAPIIDWEYVDMDPDYWTPWGIRAYVINGQHHATYEWRINDALRYSSPETPFSYLVEGFAPRFTVACRARVGAAASDWSNVLAITAP